MTQKGFICRKTKPTKQPTETMTDADYADDLVLIANTLDQAESLLYSLKQATEGIGHYVNKTEFMCFKQKRAISTLRGMPLKLTNILGCFHSVMAQFELAYLFVQLLNAK